MARVLGLGGIFFRCADVEATRAWYAKVLGIEINDFGGCSFSHGAAVAAFGEGAITVWAPFSGDTDYFGPSEHDHMFNLMVDDLDGILAKAADAGVTEIQPRETHAYGAFAWLMDPDGRKIELWQPVNPN